MRHQDPDEHRPAGCEPIASERNRYYTGKYMTPRDFTAEQTYFLSRHRLHNRLLHGWGVVCGLRVVKHPKLECADRWVVVRAGVAIDCCGRELILEADQALELPFPADTPPSGQGEPYQQPEPEPAEQAKPPAGELFVCLRYVEQLTEYAPALYNEGRCDPPRIEANRWREVASVELCPPEELKPGCWQVPQGGRGTPCQDDCDEPLPGPAGTCLEPDCPCGQAIPLARIVFDPKNPTAGYQIETAGRRTLRTPPDYLTHITWCNWPHGGELTLTELQDRKRRLEVRFDRRLLAGADQGEGSGINQFTYVVQYGNLQRGLEFVSPEGPPAVEEDGCLAVFTIGEDNFRYRSNLAGSDVLVTLKCDFVLDCHENPVDGDHLRGRLPSGNGTPGGLFESWFRVVSDGTGKGP